MTFPYSGRLVSVLLAPGIATAANLTVDTDGTAQYTHIQDAVNAASDGDTIIIGANTTYTDTDNDGYVVWIDGKNLGLKPDRGSGSVTLDGQQTAQGMVVSEAGVVLRRFTFSDCTASSGGGLQINADGGSTVELSNCSFESCEATTAGAGLYVSGDTSSHASVNLTNCSWDACSIASNGMGGGVFSYSTDLTVSNSDFTSCNSLEGAALYCKSGTFTLEDSTFSNNKWPGSFSDGSLVEISYNVTSTAISGCVFDSNGSGSFTTNLGCLIQHVDGDLTIERSTFTDNTSLQRGCIYIEAAPQAFMPSASVTINISDCEFSGNLTPHTNGITCLKISQGYTPDLENLTMCDHEAEKEISGTYTDLGGLDLGGWCCPGDIDHDGDVDADDLNDCVSSWTSSLGKDDRQDCTRDDSIDMADLLTLLNDWGTCL